MPGKSSIYRDAYRPDIAGGGDRVSSRASECLLTTARHNVVSFDIGFGLVSRLFGRGLRETGAAPS